MGRRSADDLRTRFVRYRETGSRRDRNAIVEDQLDLVEYYVSKYGQGKLEADDVRQQALMALIKAVERFDPDQGASFKTFANRTIEGELKRMLRDKGWAVRPPRSLQELAVQCRRLESELAQELGRPARAADLAERLEESTDRILEALSAGSAFRSESLDAPVGDAARPRSETVGVDADVDQVERSLDVAALLEGLDERDREIIELRFVQRLPQQEIADRVGISQSYLSRLLRRVLADLRETYDGDPDLDLPAEG